jgi:hypothetical protein
MTDNMRRFYTISMFTNSFTRKIKLAKFYRVVL